MKRPFIIGIGSSQSNAGKTTLASSLLSYLTEHKTKKQAVTNKNNAIDSLRRWGAIKYTRTSIYSSITDDLDVLRHEGKDTRKLLDAGATEVLWVQSPRTELKEIMPIAIGRLSHLDGIIIEGNSAIEFSNPDIVIFINVSKPKPSALSIFAQADIIISKDRLQTCDYSEFKLFDRNEIKRLVDKMNSIIKKTEIKRLLNEKSSIDGKITCAVARRIAEDIGASYKEIGSIANELKIKIKNCELGCF